MTFDPPDHIAACGHRHVEKRLAPPTRYLSPTGGERKYIDRGLHEQKSPKRVRIGSSPPVSANDKEEATLRTNPEIIFQYQEAYIQNGMIAP